MAVLSARWGSGPLWPIVCTIVVILCLGVTATAFYLPGAMHAAAIDAAYRGSLEVAEQIKITRGYYTKFVVAKALESGALVPSFMHRNDPKAIPLPATFVKDISELLKEKDTSLSLVSPYPWPHRADRKMDDFESTAWQAFQRDPAAVFSRQEVRDGQRILRVAVADRMTGQTCVNCHNSHEQSSRKDWKVGDVRAVMQVTKVVEPYLAASDKRSRMIVWTVAGVAALAAVTLVVVALLVTRRTREKRSADRHVHFLAHHDALTGILNRATFIQQLDATLRMRMVLRTAVAVHHIDLDGFREINDKLGHATGDELIQCVAKRLRSLCSSETPLARLGGDQFAIVQIGAHEQEVISLAAAIVEGLSAPYNLSQHEVRISASVGVKIAQERSTTAHDLLKAADLALNRAKAAGRQRYMLFTPEMHAELEDRRNVERAIREALHENGFDLHFQPICSAKTGNLEGFETLLRLPTKSGAFISPAVFIPIAEEMGLITQIGARVLKRACAIAATWPAHLTVAVNLSPAQFRQDQSLHGSVSDVVNAALASSGLKPNRLELEITESVLLETTGYVVAELERLKEIGVALVMDDFGTGYSSLSYLWKLPLDKIKIDRSFIAASTKLGPKIMPIVESITALGHLLHLRVTAEGVETIDQAAYFCGLNCDQLQGYLLGRPLPISELPTAISKDYSQFAPKIAA
jgi:diguanylate cyclase (GGDEF)-like protein